MTTFLEFIGKPPSIGAVKRGKAPVTCVSFHEDGDHLFVASANCIKGTSTELQLDVKQVVFELWKQHTTNTAY